MAAAMHLEPGIRSEIAALVIQMQGKPVAADVFLRIGKRLFEIFEAVEKKRTPAETVMGAYLEDKSYFDDLQDEIACSAALMRWLAAFQRDPHKLFQPHIALTQFAHRVKTQVNEWVGEENVSDDFLSFCTIAGVNPLVRQWIPEEALDEIDFEDLDPRTVRELAVGLTFDDHALDIPDVFVSEPPETCAEIDTILREWILRILVVRAYPLDDPQRTFDEFVQEFPEAMRQPICDAIAACGAEGIYPY